MRQNLYRLVACFGTAERRPSSTGAPTGAGEANLRTRIAAPMRRPRGVSLARHVLPGWRRVSEACSIAVRRRLPVVRGVTSRLAVHRHPLPIGRVGLLREENRNGTG